MSSVVARVPATTGRARAVHTRTQVLGLALLAAVPAILVTAAMLAGTPFGDAVYFLFPVAVAGIAAVLAWSFGTWSKVVGLLAAGFLAFSMFWMVVGLREPSSPVEFTLGSAYVVGMALALGGGVGSIVRRRDGRTEVTPAERTVERAALAIVVVAIAVSVPLWLLARESVDAGVAGGATSIAIVNSEFGSDLTVASGESVVVRNGDPFVHTFTVDELGIDVKLVPGSEVLVPIEGASGTYAFYCVPHTNTSDGIDPEHDMAGTLTIS